MMPHLPVEARTGSSAINQPFFLPSIGIIQGGSGLVSLHNSLEVSLEIISAQSKLLRRLTSLKGELLGNNVSNAF